MPIPLTPPILPMPIASGGDVRGIPEQTPAGSNQLSFQSGFPAITSTPLAAGGIPPQREDLNAACKLLSQHTFFQQSGGVYPWQGEGGDGEGGGEGGDGDSGFPGLNYLINALTIGPDGNVYTAVQPSGPDTTAGVQSPVNNPAYWRLTVFDSSELVPGTPVVLTTSGTYVFPKSGYRWITLVGGGGGGATGFVGSTVIGGGGGGSGYTHFFVKWYEQGASVPYTIGAGGAGGTTITSTTAGNGDSGGSTTFDGVSAAEGRGATGAFSSGTNLGGPGAGRNRGARGNYLTASVSITLTQAGGYGGPGFEFNGAVYGYGGHGGSAQANSGANIGTAGGAGAVIIL